MLEFAQEPVDVGLAEVGEVLLDGVFRLLAPKPGVHALSTFAQVLPLHLSASKLHWHLASAS